MHPSFFLKPSVVESEGYPKQAFIYSQLHPLVMRFEEPLRIYSFYMKKHRSSEFYKQEYEDSINVRAYLDDKLVLNATGDGHNIVWK